MGARHAHAAALGLGEDEFAVYDAVTAAGEGVYDDALLCDLIHDGTRTIKRNPKVDWTEPHRDDVRAAIRVAVKREQRRKSIRAEDLEELLERIMAQAEALYRDWPLAA